MVAEAEAAPADKVSAKVIAIIATTDDAAAINADADSVAVAVEVAVVDRINSSAASPARHSRQSLPTAKPSVGSIRSAKVASFVERVSVISLSQAMRMCRCS